jgi:hypothetical protein
VQELLSDLSKTLTAFGGTAGILRDQAPPPLDTRLGVDAVIVSTDKHPHLKQWPSQLYVSQSAWLAGRTFLRQIQCASD